jgi:uncharacterized protein (DUF697 family)
MPVASGEAGQSAKSTEQNQIAQDAAKHAQEAARNAQEKQKRADEAAEVAREAASTPPSRVGRAEAIIHRNTLWSLGAGVVPVPIFDLVALTAVQLKMLRELSQLYEVPFFENTAKKLLGALVSSLGGVTLGTAAVVSLSKLLPGMGSVLGLVAVPVSAAAFTHATGRIFLMHFESGGTFLDFNPDSLRAHFRQEFEKSKETVTRMKAEPQ